MDQKLREKYFRLIDDIPELIGAIYEIDRFKDKEKIASKLIMEGLIGKRLKSRLQEMGVKDFDDSTQVRACIRAIVLKMSRISR